LFLNLEKSQSHNGEKIKGYLTITLNKDTVSRALKFIVEGKEETPYNTFSSYRGKNAWITYCVKATIGKKMRMDVNSSINFEVISSQSNNSNFNRPVSVSTFKTNDLVLKLDLDKSVYNAGDKIRGTINISKLNPDIDIRGIETILIATEKATASSRIVASTMYENKYKITDWKEKQDCPFEINIPEDVVKSYRGKYSEIIWKIKAIIDLPLSQDLNAEAMIEVI